MSTLASVVIRDLIANQPAAGIAGRLFFATDTGAAYRDDGSSWSSISSSAFLTESANLVYAGPASGSAATPTFRALVAADLPAVSGTVTSIALTTPAWLSVSGSPVTTSGTLAVTATGSETANEFLATPDGSSGAVGLRAIAPADLPVATTSALGAVKPDGTTVTISAGVITATSGAGTVTSVGISVPADYSVSGSPVTTSGTLAVTENTQAANLVKAGPTSGLAAAPTFRTLVASDLPLATTSAFGAVKPDGSTVDVSSGVISVPTATTSLLGLVKPDGSTIDVSSGIISVPTATPSLLGIVKPDGTTITASSGVISANAVTSVGLTTPSWLSVAGSPVTSSGTLAITATSSETANEFLATPNGSTGAVGLRAIVPADLPEATSSAFGTVKPDNSTITISAGVLSATGATVSSLQQEAYTYAADTGTANAYAVTLSPSPTIVAGSEVVFKAANANTGASTLAVNSAGALAIKKNGGSTALASGDIAAGEIITAKYDGSAYQILVSNPGTVTSVGLTAPSWLSVSGTPVTSAGTLAVTATSDQTANEFLATPNGSSGSVALRAIAPADLPVATTSALGAVKPDGSSITISSGVISSTALSNPMMTTGDIIYGGSSGAPTRLAAGSTSGYVLTSNGSAAAPSWQASGGGGGSGSKIAVGTLATFISSPPSSPSAGDTYNCTDTAYAFIYTGSAWQAYWKSIPVSLPAQSLGEASTLSGNGGSITSVATTFNVASTFAATAPFLAIVDTEVVKVTSQGSGTDWTVVRGYDSTAATHSDSTAITLLNWQELNSVSGFVKYPGSGAHPYGGLNVLAPSGDGSALVKMLAPSTTPYTATAAIRFDIGSDTDSTGFGLAFREQSTGAITSWDLGHSTTWQFQSLTMSDPNTVVAPYTITQPNYIPVPYAGLLWLQIQDDGSSLNTYYSWNDGITWTNFFSVSRLDYTTPDEIGFWVYGQGASTGATLLSWSVALV